ncbi:OprO/OprP family phosphate-selective porin [Altericroceibacterium xinjiangense]|uniref:OprO/OprP family phosphate-selective porin n=1 Tax=Altericroceibacterium xinjiangense TaxID=762261 RepID=UPI001F49ADEC|nr:porin [Altericroceibacterium xinjiangense]
MVIALGWALPAQAQQADEAAELRAELARMRAQMEAIAERIDTLERERESVDPARPTGAGADAIASAAAPVAEVAGPDPVPAGAPVPVENLASAEGWTFEPFGRVQVDAGVIDAPDAISAPGLGFVSGLRRARIGVAGDLPGDFGYKIEVDFSSGDLVLNDALLAYDAGDLRFQIGHYNTFQGLEELTSSLFISFLERAAFTDAFVFQRRTGVSGQYETDDVLLQAGVFTNNVHDASEDGNARWSVDGRAVYAPQLGQTRLHFGGSLHHRELNDVDTVRYRQRPHLNITDVRFVNTGAISAESETGYGLEAAAISGPFHFASEAFWQKVQRPGLADPTFFGGSIEAGMFLTPGDRRGYKGFKFDRVRPVSPLGEGGFGALQVNVRYDLLDLVDAGIVGGTQNNYSASLIWIPAAYTRFLIDYSHLVYDDAVIAAGADRDYSVDVIGMRAQVDF